jgi:hypothetical protein
MKATFYLITATVLTISLTSCSKNSNIPSPSTPNPTIVAKWYYAADTVRYYRNGVLGLTAIGLEQSPQYVQYNADGIGVSSGQGPESAEYFSYRVSGNKLISTTFNGQTNKTIIDTADILKLTTDSLYVHYTDVFSDSSYNVVDQRFSKTL